MKTTVRPLLIALALATGAAQAQDPAPLVIGQTAAFTGPQSEPVKETTIAARAYFERLNARGGVNGRKVVLESLDDGYDPKRSVENATRLIEERHAVALFLFRGTANAEAMMAVAQDHHVPMFAGVGSSYRMHQPPSRYVFNLRAPVQTEVTSVVRQLVSQGARDISVVYTDDGFGKDALDGAKRAFAENKIEPKVIAAIPRGQADVADAVKKIAAAAPRATLGFCIPKTCAAIVKGLREKGSITEFVSLSNTSSTAYVEELGSYSRGVMVTQVMPFPFDSRDAISVEFQQFAREAQVKPSYAAMEGWLSARVLAEALRRAGPKVTPETLVTAFESLNLNLGGFNVAYSPRTRTGSEFVELTMISKNGRFIR
jgi:branched-chain amino acid transport system substrate-binding protein